MRIGQFAKKNQVSVDTIRHYMDLGLIVPEKKGGQYDFDNRCQADFKLISEFKALGFQLNEMKLFMLYKHFGNLTHYEEDSYYQSLFVEKRQKIETEIMELIRKKEKLDHKIGELFKTHIDSKAVSGVDLPTLRLLICGKCNQTLSLQNGTIYDNQVVEGTLICKCNQKYGIKDGIIIVNRPYSALDGDMILENHINNYIKITDSEYLQNISKGFRWSKRKLDTLDLHQKVMLELGSGVGFFLRNLYQDLPEDCLYIAVDHNLERHRFLKSLLERTKLRRNVLFICADFLEIPIGRNTVDVLIDQTGTSNYSFEHQSFLLKEVDQLVKNNGALLGSYFVFKNFSSKSKIAPEVRSNFLLQSIKNNLVELKYELIEEINSEILHFGGKYEDFFVKGEEVYTYTFFGKRSG